MKIEVIFSDHIGRYRNGQVAEIEDGPFLRSVLRGGKAEVLNPPDWSPDGPVPVPGVSVPEVSVPEDPLSEVPMVPVRMETTKREHGPKRRQGPNPERGQHTAASEETNKE